MINNQSDFLSEDMETVSTVRSAQQGILTLYLAWSNRYGLVIGVCSLVLFEEYHYHQLYLWQLQKHLLISPWLERSRDWLGYFLTITDIIGAVIKH